MKGSWFDKVDKILNEEEPEVNEAAKPKTLKNRKHALAKITFGGIDAKVSESELK